MDIARLEAMLEKGENALLRYSLGNAYYRDRRKELALAHLARAVELEPGYSAAWKLYGRCLMDCGRRDAARAALEQGMTVAREKGDMQALREMTAFLRKLERE